MEIRDNVVSISNITESEDFIRKHCNIHSIEEFLQELLRSWLYKWNDFDDIITDVNEKIKNAHTLLLENCVDENFSEGLQISLECLILNKLHDHILPLICYVYQEEDSIFYNKCKALCDLNITAEQLGAPEDYSIPLAAAVVEFASLDARKSPTEKIYCLCTTFDLVFAELKAAIVEIISSSTDENKIPIIENRDIIPILMIVIIKSKLIHIHTNMYYIEKFLWKLQESDHIQKTIAIFKNAITQIQLLNDQNLAPSSGKVHKDLDLVEVSNIMTQMETSSENRTDSMLENYIKRVTNLIFTSTNSST